MSYSLITKSKFLNPLIHRPHRPYIIYLSRHCVSQVNVLSKYAGDTNLLVTENAEMELAIEFSHIQDWAIRCATKINIHLTKELVFYRPHPRRFRYKIQC